MTPVGLYDTRGYTRCYTTHSIQGDSALSGTDMRPIWRRRHPAIVIFKRAWKDLPAEDSREVFAGHSRGHTVFPGRALPSVELWAADSLNTREFIDS